MNSGVLIDLSPTTGLECVTRISVVTMFYYFRFTEDIVHCLLLWTWNVLHVFQMLMLQYFSISGVLGIMYIGFFYGFAMSFTYFRWYNLFLFFTIFSMFFTLYYIILAPTTDSESSCNVLQVFLLECFTIFSL